MNKPDGKKALVVGDTANIARVLKSPTEFGFYGLPDDKQWRDGFAKSIKLMHQVLMPALMPRFMSSSIRTDIAEISRDFFREMVAFAEVGKPVNTLIEDFVTTVIFKCIIGSKISNEEMPLFRSSQKADLSETGQASTVISRILNEQTPLSVELLKTEKAENLYEGWAIEQLMSLVFAGAGTTSTFITMALARMALNPEMQSLIAAEKNAEAAPFTDAFLKEVLRLNPPVLTISREALEDNFFEEFGVSKGMEVILNLYPGLNDTNVFGAHCDQFAPERWLQRKIESSAFIPFGYGPHICIGRHLAMMEASILLKELCSMAELSLTSGFELPNVEHLGRATEIIQPLFLKSTFKG
ncbi:MAG: cytochrome P450 [Bdellovibrio sp.]|nr:cytochrome P450 [Bdellovibrio sp.]